MFTHLHDIGPLLFSFLLNTISQPLAGALQCVASVESSLKQNSHPLLVSENLCQLSHCLSDWLFHSDFLHSSVPLASADLYSFSVCCCPLDPPIRSYLSLDYSLCKDLYRLCL